MEELLFRLLAYALDPIVWIIAALIWVGAWLFKKARAKGTDNRT